MHVVNSSSGLRQTDGQPVTSRLFTRTENHARLVVMEQQHVALEILLS